MEKLPAALWPPWYGFAISREKEFLSSRVPAETADCLNHHVFTFDPITVARIMGLSDGQGWAPGLLWSKTGLSSNRTFSLLTLLGRWYLDAPLKVGVFTHKENVLIKEKIGSMYENVGTFPRIVLYPFM